MSKRKRVKEESSDAEPSRGRSSPQAANAGDTARALLEDIQGALDALTSSDVEEAVFEKMFDTLSSAYKRGRKLRKLVEAVGAAPKVEDATPESELQTTVKREAETPSASSGGNASEAVVPPEAWNWKITTDMLKTMDKDEFTIFQAFWLIKDKLLEKVGISIIPSDVRDRILTTLSL